MNIAQIMKQAQAMQKKMADMQEELAKKTFEGTSGGGAVKITITGKGELKEIKIDPAMANPDDIEILEDLIIAAFNDAKKKSDAESEDSYGGMMGNMGMPAGFKFPF
jgi:nucleoid-associated protein EbfC